MLRQFLKLPRGVLCVHRYSDKFGVSFIRRVRTKLDSTKRKREVRTRRTRHKAIEERIYFYSLYCIVSRVYREKNVFLMSREELRYSYEQSRLKEATKGERVASLEEKEKKERDRVSRIAGIMRHRFRSTVHNFCYYWR